MITHETVFDLRECVNVAALDTKATILQICMNGSGTEYEVAYWLDGKYTKQWLPERELKARRE